ncbi:hypothetical protein GCM10010324_19160 [Streptomyces hiroshimensis]|uniref:DUF6603 domain-containing protein n=1 Tax=Streptomyces hiroshimensis TaxID=66424 RepID=A0ABQ2Y9H7_9ACTN|nr:hypothetical protein GCM10010324_19160 [Streptomyces hiroshimensis]
MNVGALEKWFTVETTLTGLALDPDHMRLSGTIAPSTPLLSLSFFTDDDSAPAPDDAEIVGVRIALSLTGNPVLGILGDIGLQDLTLVYEIRMLDGAAVRKLSAQGDVGLPDGDALTITCALDFEAESTSYEFVVEPEEGKQFHVAQAFFGLFGAAPPPVLKDIALERLAIAYDRGTGTSGFRVEVDAAFPLGDVAADLDVKVALAKRAGEPGYDQVYSARLALTVSDDRTLTFAVKDAQHADFSATCEDTKGVSLADLAELLGVADASAAEVLAKLGTVTGLTVGYSAARKSVVFAAEDKPGGGMLVVVSDKPTTTEARAWAVRVDLGLNAMLSQAPLLQGQIPEDQDAGVRGLGVLITSQDLPAARITELNKALVASDEALPLLPADGLRKGVAFTVDLQLPGRSETISLLVRGGGGGSDSKRHDKPTPAPSPERPRLITEDGTPVAAPHAQATGLPLVAWADVQRSVGPLRLRRVGVGFADGTVWVLFDASMGMAGLELGVEGLGLGIPLSDPKHVGVRLDGLSVAYSRPPLAIEGALVNRPADQTYDTLVEGALAVSAAKFGLTVLGAYAQPHEHPDQPSMFLFGKVNGRFGGPPPVQITEIMAGFGFNTDLRLPEGDEVLTFPFLTDMTATQPLDVLDTLMGGDEKAWVRPASGQMWFAAGLGFNLFEFIDGQALLVLEVGDDFAVAVLGTATAEFPKQGPEKYARVLLGLSAKYRESERVLKITAQLAPGSYLIDQACVLTGGFALYTWFDDAHAGDFVLTLGGYHPKFTVPAHYPQVPRLGFSWPVTSELTISGGSYFALTPGAIMAGGALDVNYRSGDLHAWLNAHADMLIEWAPFHFDAEIGVSIGVSYVLDLWLVRETISVEVGASLRLWGPPTAGEVTIHLWFISFTIAFGDGSARDDHAAPWSDVVNQLPAAKDAVRLVPMDGLLPARSAEETDMWIVGPGAFSFAVRTAVPVSTLHLAGSGSDIQGNTVNIRPRRDDGKGLASVLTVTLTQGDDTHDLSTWYVKGAEQKASLPAALWGPYEGPYKDKPVKDIPQRVDDQLMGVDLRLPPAKEGGSPGPVEAGTIAHDERTPDGILPLRKPAAVARPVTLELFAEAAVRSPGDTGNVAGATGGQAGPLVDQSRDRLFAAMEYLGVSPGTNDRLTAVDALVAGDVTAETADPVPGTPTASERLYVLGAGQTMTPVDAQSLTAYERFPLKNAGPTHMALSPDGSRLCVVNPTTQHVDAFDISANPPADAVSLATDKVWLAQNERGVAFSPDSKWAYVTCEQPNQLLILDLTGTAPVVRHQVGTLTKAGGDARPAGVAAAVPWDDKHQVVYIALPDDGTVVKMDVGNLANPTPQGWLPAGPSPTRLAVDPKGRWLYALNAGRSTVTVVDVTSAGTGVVTTLRTGTDPSALVVSPDGDRLYVAGATSGTVAVFDTSGTVPQEAGDPVWVGAEPIALAVSSAGDRLYVARSKQRALVVVDVSVDPPALLPVTIGLPDDPLALAVTVPAADSTRTKEGGAA